MNLRIELVENGFVVSEMNERLGTKTKQWVFETPEGLSDFIREKCTEYLYPVKVEKIKDKIEEIKASDIANDVVENEGERLE